MMVPLPSSFLDAPIAHRGLHDLSAGRPENSIEAFQAAIDGGFGIELDLQVTADGQAVVFHDYRLNRLTEQTGLVRERSLDALSGMLLKGGDSTIPSLREVLELVGGRVPLLAEVKDQDGALGENVGALEQATAAALAGYDGDVAVMSFNPHSVAALRDALPGVARGLVTEEFSADEYPAAQEALDRLSEIADFERVGASFISHDVRTLDMARVAELKANGVPVLTWTVRSPEQEAVARRVADNVTFEGYLPG